MPGQVSRTIDADILSKLHDYIARIYMEQVVDVIRGDKGFKKFSLLVDESTDQSVKRNLTIAARTGLGDGR